MARPTTKGIWDPSTESPISDLALLVLEEPMHVAPLRLASNGFPKGRLTGDAWDAHLPGFLGFKDLRPSSDGFASEGQGVLVLVAQKDDPESRPSFSGFPIFNARRELAALHQKAEDLDMPRLGTPSARMIRWALHYYVDAGGLYVDTVTDLLTEDNATPPEVGQHGRVHRSREFAQILETLLAPTDIASQRTSITAICGDGGFGKTTLAEMIYEDPALRAHLGTTFVKVTIGSGLRDVALRYQGIAREIDPNSRLDGSEVQVAKQLGDLLRQRHGLILIDDVWHEIHLRPFMELGPNLRVLITTRDQSIANTCRFVVPVEEMEGDDAARLLGRGLEATTEADATALRGPARKLHACAIVLEAANALREPEISQGKALADAIIELEE